MTCCSILNGYEEDKEWMLFSADTRTSIGAEFSERYDKIFQLSNKVYMVFSGDTENTFELYRKFSQHVEKEHPNIQSYNVESVAQLMYRVMHDYINFITLEGNNASPLDINMGIGGFDKSGGSIYQLDISHNEDLTRELISSPYMNTGSGPLMGRGVIRRWVKAFGGDDYQEPCTAIEMPLAEGIKCLTHSHLLAAKQLTDVSEKFQIKALYKKGNKITAKKIRKLSIREMKQRIKDEERLSELLILEPEKIRAFLHGV